MREFYTPDQLAERWQQPKSTILKRIRQRVIKALNVGTDRSPIYRISGREVERFERARTAA